MEKVPKIEEVINVRVGMIITVDNAKVLSDTHLSIEIVEIQKSKLHEGLDMIGFVYIPSAYDVQGTTINYVPKMLLFKDILSGEVKVDTMETLRNVKLIAEGLVKYRIMLGKFGVVLQKIAEAKNK